MDFEPEKRALNGGDDAGVIWCSLTFHCCSCVCSSGGDNRLLHHRPGGVPLLSPQTESLCEHFVAWLLWRAWVLAPAFARSLCLYLIMLTGFTLVQVQALSRFLLFLFVSFLCVQTQAGCFVSSPCNPPQRPELENSHFPWGVL